MAVLGFGTLGSIVMHTTSQIDGVDTTAKRRRLRCIQLVLISPALVVLALVLFHNLAVSHSLLVAHIYDLARGIVFYSSPILFLYNVVLLFRLARQLDLRYRAEPIMMAIVVMSSFILLIAVVSLVWHLICVHFGWDEMPVPAG